jgi:hypothetical protein
MRRRGGDAAPTTVRDQLKQRLPITREVGRLRAMAGEEADTVGGLRGRPLSFESRNVDRWQRRW